MRTTFLLSSLIISGLPLIGQTTITANLDYNNPTSISPLIYGYNQDHETVGSTENFTIRRLGGNRLSVFNWENGASNSGDDKATPTNDNRIPDLLGVKWADKDKVGEVYRFFHQENTTAGMESIITIPLSGYAAADKNGNNTTAPPSSRWKEVVFKKPSALSITPNTSDDYVYVDESIYFLKQTFGDANSGGVKYISLGNEPGYWDNTHSHVHATNPTVKDYVNRVIEAAKAIKAVDPNVKLIAGEFAGPNLYKFGSASDWSTEKATGSYTWFLDYFLDKLKQASTAEGYDLIDILAIHNYPQHKVNSNGDFDASATLVRNNKSTASYIRDARMQSIRSLWDETYVEPSWITKPNGGLIPNESTKILKRVQASIDQYYPNLPLMIGEWDTGFDTDISNGISIADGLGVFAQHNIQIANRWDLDPGSGTNTYSHTAFRLFRNYDGNNSTYGDQKISTSFNNPATGSVWASLNTSTDDIHLILINKEQTSSSDFVVNLNNVGYNYTIQGIYQMDQSSTNITQPTHNGTINNGSLNISVPALAVNHVIIKRTMISVNKLEIQKENTIKFNQNTRVLSGLNENWMLYNSTGKLVLSGNVTEIQLPHLPIGLYTVVSGKQHHRFLSK